MIAGSGQGAFVGVHVTDFASLTQLWAWRQEAERELRATPGLAFAKLMASIGSRESEGFGAGIPNVRRQVMLTAWPSVAEFEAFLGHGLMTHLVDDARHNRFALCAVRSTRGSHYGRRPLVASQDADSGGPMAALTLGRATPRTLARFLLHGARLAEQVQRADGLITAVSAGVPLTGNCTFSLWTSKEAMLRFAYGQPGAHSATVKSRPAILVEQLNARLEPVAIEGSWNGGIGHNPGR